MKVYILIQRKKRLYSKHVAGVTASKSAADDWVEENPDNRMYDERKLADYYEPDYTGLQNNLLNAEKQIKELKEKIIEKEDTYLLHLQRLANLFNKLLSNL